MLIFIVLPPELYFFEYLEYMFTFYRETEDKVGS